MKKAICLDLAINWHGIATGGGVIENIGLGYIAAILKDYGYETEIFQLPLNAMTLAGIKKNITGKSLVAMSSMIYNADLTINFARFVRKFFPKVQLVVGGAGPSGWPEKYAPYFNAVICGEGEAGLKAWLNGNYATGSIINVGRDRNWNGRPWPLRDQEVINTTRMCGISPIAYSSQRVAATCFSRGCPGNCWFCCSPGLWQRKIYWRSYSEVVDEIEFLIESYGVNMIDFCDNAFNTCPNKVLPLCAEMIKRRLNKKCLFFATCDPSHGTKAQNHEMFGAMKEAGFFKVAFGLEGSTSEERRSLTKIDPDIDKCLSSLAAADESGLLIRGYLIIGTPEQNEWHIEQLKASLLSWPLDELRISIFCPFPGSQSWRDLQPVIEENDLTKYDANWPIIKHPVWSKEDIIALRTSLTKHFYSGRNYLERRARRIATAPAYKIGYEQLENFLRKANFL